MVSAQIIAARENAPDDLAKTSKSGLILFRPIAIFILGFLLLSGFFMVAQHALRYVTAGSEIVYQAKLRDETHGLVFPKSTSAQKIVVFGNSTILAGLVSKRFDALAKADGLDTYTYNSGYPGHADFVPQLKALVESGNGPDIVLLTKPWAPAKGSSFFKLPVSDLELANEVFPFRTFIRDAASFAFTARSRGGIRAFYRASEENERRMESDQGYYFISEQSHFAHDQLPDDFHLPDDRPTVPQSHEMDPSSPELAELNAILRAHSIQCFYVPYPTRASAIGEAPAVDAKFKQVLESNTPCKLVGPYYYRYPNRDLSDQTHLNHVGSVLYTQNLYQLMKPLLMKKGR